MKMSKETAVIQSMSRNNHGQLVDSINSAVAQILVQAPPREEMVAPPSRGWGWNVWGVWRYKICLGLTPRDSRMGFRGEGCDDLLHFPCVGNAWASWSPSISIAKSGERSFHVRFGLLLWDLGFLWFCVTVSVAAQDYCAREKFPPCHGKHAPALCPPEQSHLSARTSHPAWRLVCRAEWWNLESPCLPWSKWSCGFHPSERLGGK